MKLIPAFLGLISGYLIASALQVVYTINLIQLNINHPFLPQAIVYIVMALALIYLLVNKFKLDYNEVFKFVSIGFLTFLLITSIAILTEPRNESQYTSWNFHECYSQTLNAEECSNTVIKTFPGKENTGYDYYPPVTHLIAKVIPLQILLLLILSSLWFLTWIATSNPLTPVVVFYSTLTIWTSFITGGTVPFFLALLFLITLTFYWSKFSWLTRITLLVLTMFTHVFVGWLAVVLFLLFLACEWFKVSRFLPSFLLVFAVACYYLVYFDVSVRVLLIPVLYTSVLFIYFPTVYKKEV